MEQEEVYTPACDSSLIVPRIVDGSNNGLALFVGNVIVRSVLLEQVHGTRHLAG